MSQSHFGDDSEEYPERSTGSLCSQRRDRAVSPTVCDLNDAILPCNRVVSLTICDLDHAILPLGYLPCQLCIRHSL